ncbi:hypothetical protein FRACYDRAFT_245759 [Fragilariopsis cylindrus CCMP1102]|uniref:Uncharacterized protein n=1 Tax=Fragilariopsis cylindrus CCMP1102 TaxID=635003 RepID=A0A1E7EZK8_9STRA|nr:hypothetical protein FRACYDRAFT_245759 [Fragilariopsis cylindrus CCMP1102]|eukprot:OEU11361.1 hypothetical protein FRACYDRAFT_245759 [Fragilariopsis cylindrus CCMP1102]
MYVYSIEQPCLLKPLKHLKQTDSLVLVGTLRSIPNDYVRFEHEQVVHQMMQHNTNQFQFQQQQQDEDNGNDDDNDEEEKIKKKESTNNNNGISISDYCTGQDFHIMKTLDEEDNCLSLLDRMKNHLHQRQQDIDNDRSNNTHNSDIRRRPTIAPQTRWYYVPNIITQQQQQQQQPPIMYSCLELDGYVTSLENEEEEENDDDDNENDEIDIDDTDNEDANRYNGFGAASSVVPVGDEDLLYRALAPFDDNNNDKDDKECDTDIENNSKNKNKNNKTKIAREWRNYLQISQSHVSSGADSSPSTTTTTTTSSTTNSTTLAGYLLKKSEFDPYVWKLHYCLLTEDDFWYVPRIKNKHKNKNVRNTNEIITTSEIEMASYHGRIPLIDTLLLDNSKTGRRHDEFEIVDGNGITHTYRCPTAAEAAPATTTTTTTTRAAVAVVVAKDWKNMLSIRSQNAFENSLIKHAELILTEENLSRTERWKKIVVNDECDDNNNDKNSDNDDDNDDGTKTKEGRRINASLTVVSSSPSSRSILMYNGGGGGGSSASSNHSLRLQLQSKILRFGMNIAEYKENCRHIQTLLWVDYSSAAAATVVVAPSSNGSTTTTTNSAKNDVSSTSSSSSTTTTLRLVRETWKEASGLLQQAIQIILSINKHRERDISRSLDTMCRHIEYIITRQRRRRQAPSQFSDDNKNDDEIIRNSSSLDDDTSGNEDEASSVSSGRDAYHDDLDHHHHHHHRDPPPIELFDLLLNDLRAF